jgi:hypothetical protein
VVVVVAGCGVVGVGDVGDVGDVVGVVGVTEAAVVVGAVPAGSVVVVDVEGGSVVVVEVIAAGSVGCSSRHRMVSQPHAVMNTPFGGPPDMLASCDRSRRDQCQSRRRDAGW